jgi:hypothetical protein
MASRDRDSENRTFLELAQGKGAAILFFMETPLPTPDDELRIALLKWLVYKRRCAAIARKAQATMKARGKKYGKKYRP